MSRLSLLLFVLLGCQKMDEALAGPPQKLKSTDGALELTVPGGWKTDTLNDKAVLQASARKDELYVIVLSQPKDNLEEMNLDKYSQTTRTSQLQAMKNGVEKGPMKRAVGGLQGLEYVLEGQVDGKGVTMKHVSVDGPKRYHQVIAWTLTSKWEAQSATLDKVIDSLKELN